MRGNPKFLVLSAVLALLASWARGQDARTISRAGTPTALVLNVQNLGLPGTSTPTATATPTVVLINKTAAVTVASEIAVTTPTSGKIIKWLFHTLTTDGAVTVHVHFQATATAGNTFEAVQAPAVGAVHDFVEDARPTGPVSVGVWIKTSGATTVTLNGGYREISP